MKPFVFITDQCKKDAEDLRLSHLLDEYYIDVEINGNLHPLSNEYDRFPGHYVKYPFSGSDGKKRIVEVYKDFKIEKEEIRIYVALRFFMRNDSTYDKIIDKDTKNGERAKITGLDEIDWDKYEKIIRERLKQPEEIIKLPELNQSEIWFINSPTEINHEILDFAIYETKEWKESVLKDDFKPYDAAEIIQEHVNKTLEDPDGPFEIPFKYYEGKKIVGYKEGDSWTLVNIIDINEEYEIEKDAPKRGYSLEFIEGDKDLWEKMEKDKNSNFVLSPQEMAIVSNKETEYPLLIDGRAGSGKSTVLQYLFAEILLRYLKSQNEIEGSEMLPPVYISYSDELIKKAKDQCQSFFETYPSYKKILKIIGRTYKNDIEPIQKDIFCVFTELVKDCIRAKNPDIVNTRFADNKKMTFTKFKKVWREKFGRAQEAKKMYSAEVCWHIIRSYIKGWNSESIMNDKGFMQIGKQNITSSNVTYETFKLVYEKVYLGWYSNLDCWDEQDLVRYCLCPDDGSTDSYAKEKFSAIFCDESQDFTRVEIEFILKISSFSNRRLESVAQIKQLPFVFAGDEFQTINPTGFSWDSLRSYFVERLFAKVGLGHLYNESQLADPVQLTENYRSASQIVNLGNRIQLLRTTRFWKKTDPQGSYFKEVGKVICLQPDDPDVFKELEEKAVDLIVPIEDGMTVPEWLENCPFKDYISKDKNGWPNKITILKPSQAKGLEYPNVAIYGFNCENENSPLNFHNLMNWYVEGERELDYDKEKDISLKYTLSNAYVAATRATKKLFILDKFDMSSFWAFAYSHNKRENDVAIHKLQDLMLSRTKNPKWNSELLGWIDFGDASEITDENKGDYKTIQSLKEKNAEKNDDVEILLQVAARYNSSGDKKGYYRCRAKVAKISMEYEEAAELFDKAELFDDAVDCLWLELSNNPNAQLAEKIVSYRQKSNDKRIGICVECMKKNIQLTNIKNILLKITSLLDNSVDNRTIDVKVYDYLISHSFLKAQYSDANESIIKTIISIRNNLKEKYSLLLSPIRLAEIAFSINLYKESIILWEESGTSKFPKNYYTAKTKTTNYPDNLKYFSLTGSREWQNTVLDIFIENGKDLKSLDVKERKIILECIRAVGDNDIYREYLLDILINIENESQGKVILKELYNKKIKLNYEVINALIAAKFNNLILWKSPEKEYVDRRATDLFTILEYVKEIKNDKFTKELDNNLKEYKSRAKYYYSNKFRPCLNSTFTPIIFNEIGIIIEKRGIYIDAIRFYEWARTQVASDEERRKMDIRWVACKEKQAKLEDDEGYIEEAQNKRNEISYYEESPLSPIIEDWEWETMFREAIDISGELKIRRPRISDVDSNTERKDNPVIEESQDNSGTEIVQKEPVSEKQLPNNKYEFSHKNYSIVYFPGKGDIVIKNVDEEFSARIRNGKFPSDADFYLKESRLYQTEDNVITPFVIEINDEVVSIKIYEGEVYTGFAFRCELIASNSK